MLNLEFNHIDHEWKVLDNSSTMGSGKTIGEAIDSARIVSDETIYLHGRVFDEA